MFAAVLIGLLATAAAAPQWSHYGPPPPHGPPYHGPPHHGPPHRHGPPRHHEPYASEFGYDMDPFAGDIFDTKQFWAQLANEMAQIEQALAMVNERFSSANEVKIEGNEYKITIPLRQFDEKDIVVKAKEGFLMVQAVHKSPEGGENIYIDAKTLPANVNVTGTWTFSDGVLKIIFPLKADAEGTEVLKVPTEGETESPFKDREEMDSESSEGVDADVGLRKDLDKENPLLTNEIPKNKVPPTTYLVDLKDEVEFVPVRHNK